MNENAMAITILCSHLCLGEGVKPFEPSEWSKIAEKLIQLNLTPAALLNFSSTDLQTYFTIDEVERINRLIDRSGSISFEINKYSQQGINIITRADSNYPKMLKTKLGKTCPPLFYYSGDLSICCKEAIGFVGSRNIDAEDKIFTQQLVNKVNAHDYSLVSGGAKGIDSESVAASLKNGSCAIEYISDSLLSKIKKKDVINAIRNNQIVILSIAKPDAGFNTGIAMTRNKFIYAQSSATVVVRSDYNKGGTWSGAMNAIKKELCPVFCRNNADYPGNIALIKNGAIPIDENWDCDITKIPLNQKQLSLFD